MVTRPIEIELLRREFHRREQNNELIEFYPKISKETRKAVKQKAIRYDITEEEMFYIALKIGLYLETGEL